MNIEYPITILIDTGIISSSDTMQGTDKVQTIVWGDKAHNVNIAGFKRKPMPSADHEWLRDQIKCLPTVGRIAREGKVELYTYNELTNEEWKRPGSFPANVLGNLLAGVTFKYVDAAVERSFFFDMDISENVSKEQVVKFCKWLLEAEVETFADRLEGQKKYSAFLLNNLREVERFREISKGLSGKQYPDAFHLWTAEVNCIKYFLTLDKKFINAMTTSKRIDLPCKILSPSDVLDMMEIKERDPFEYDENQFFDLFGNPD